MASENAVMRLLLQQAVQCHQSGAWEQAESLYREVLRHEPQNADATHLLGVLAHQAGYHEQAEQLIASAIAIDAGVAGYHVNLAAILMDVGKLDEAAASCRQAIALQPDIAEAHNNLGSCLLELGYAAEAITAFRAALKANPAYAAAHSNLIWAMLFDPASDAETQARERRNWQRLHAAPLRSQWRPHAHDRSPARRLRVGYVSPDFCDHVVGFNLLPLFEHHDRTAFEVYCYSDAARADAVTERFRTLADQWRDITTLSDDDAASLIREDRIDILVDLALHTANNRLLVFARKPAPVQLSFAGYPGGTGLEAIDAHLTDRFLEPTGSDALYDRALPALESFWCYQPQGTPEPVGPLPAKRNGVITFGCLNRFCKVNDSVLRAWAAVMRGVDGSRLVMMAAAGTPRERTTRFLAAEGIATERITFVERLARDQYLRAFHDIDICLDSFPYNGHTTSLDALWMGVPAVTVVGATVVGRAGLSQLSNLGLAELAGSDVAEFAQIAVKLATDQPRLEQMRAGLRGRMETSPLRDARGFARRIEGACRELWARWCGQ